MYRPDAFASASAETYNDEIEERLHCRTSVHQILHLSYFGNCRWLHLWIFGKQKKTECFIAETAKGCIRTPFIPRKRPVPRGNTEPARSIGWVPAPAPFPTSVRGHDPQRDRCTKHGGPNPVPLASEADALPTVPRGRPVFPSWGAAM